MAQLPPIKRISSEDFGDSPEIANKLLPQINQFFESVVQALSNGLTVKDNLSADIKTVELDGTFPVKMSWGKGKPLTVIPGNIERSDGSSFTLTDAVGIRWSYNQNGQIQIDQVVGITPTNSVKYKLTVEIKMG